MSNLARIQSVGIVGSGTMGIGIAQTMLKAGMQVVLHDTSDDALVRAHSRVGANFGTASLTFSTQIAALDSSDLVIEAVPESAELKMQVLRSISGIVKPSAIIASNTSCIPLTGLATAVTSPEKFLGIHFFNPVPRMPLVEVVSTALTDPTVTTAVTSLISEQLGKTPLVLADRPGFVVNALLIPYLLASVRMLDAGYADARTIDLGMTQGCGHPVGPLALCDLIGLDVVVSVADALHAETGDPATVVPHGLRSHVQAGDLGRKSGRGFYRY